MHHENNALPPCSTIGIVGGGQLGRMMAMAAASLGYRTCIFTPEKDSPAQAVADITIIADYEDKAALLQFAKTVNAITVEFENIPVETARFLNNLQSFYPSPDIFAICQHRGKEKTFARDCGIDTAPFRLARSLPELKEAVQEIGTTCIIKSTTMGYDGKGQVRLQDSIKCEEAWDALNTDEVIIEGFVSFKAEASVIIARDGSGYGEIFPVTRNEHEGGILRRSIVPSGLSSTAINQMEKAARLIADKFDLCGLLAIEFFVLENDKILFNEMAPRPHNSGHWTMNGSNVSQFEQAIRICTGLPIRKPFILSATEMINLIGSDMNELEKWVANPHANIHLYGKRECREGRKMGHINLLHYLAEIQQ